MNKSIIAVIIISLIIGAISSHFLFQKKITTIKTERDTTYISVEVIKEKLIPKFITNTDTIEKFVFVNPETKDTIKVDKQYIAKTDTTFITDKDTTNVKVEYVSPIPLSNLSYFNLRINYNKPVITETNYVEVKEGLKLFGLKLNIKHGVQAGIGYGTIHQQVDVYVGYGISITF